MLADELSDCTALSTLKLSGTVSLLPSHSRPPHLTRHATCTGNGITANGDTNLLLAAVEGPAYAWIADMAGHIHADSLAVANLPVELASHDDSGDGITSFLRQLQLGVGCRRARLVVVGPQGVGKTSLLWRLANPDATKSLPLNNSTNGIKSGATTRCLLGYIATHLPAPPLPHHHRGVAALI